MRYVLSVLVLAGSLATGSAQAASILINGSFEIGPALDGPLCPIAPASCQDVDVVAGSLAIPGWTVFGDSIDYLGQPWDVSDGMHAVDLDGRDALFSGVSQTFATQPGREYEVSFDLSGNPQGGPVVKQVLVLVGGFAQDYFFDTTGMSINNLDWTTMSFSFMAVGPTSTLSFVSLTGERNSFGPLIDNVSVPEPTTLLLLGTGLAAAGYRRRRKS